MASLFRPVKVGTVDVSVFVRVVDSTDGTPETGVAFNTAGVDLWYRRDGGLRVAITEATLAAVDSAHSDGGFIHMSDGECRLDLPDAACASGAAGVLVGGTFTGMVVISTYIPLVAYDPYDTVRLGLTFAPNVASGSAGAIPTTGTGANQIAVSSGQVLVQSGTAAGQISVTSGIVSAVLTTAGNNAVADQVWDEATSGHLTSGSFGAALSPTEHGTAQAGGANTITLRAGAVATDDYYIKQLLTIVAGTGAGQSEYISDYVGATKVATMGASWAVQPDNTSIYILKGGGTIPGASAPTAAEVADAVFDEAMSGHTSAGTFGAYINAPVTRIGTAQAGTTSSITLDASASATNNLYRYHEVWITGGTGAGEASFITGYTGSSKVATVDPAFTVAPDSTSTFALVKLGIDAATPTQVATAVWAATRAGNATAGSFGEYVNADATRLAGNATSATNAKNAFDGTTGYTFVNSVMPTVTTLTGHTAQTGDSFARLGAPAGASVSADIAAVKSDSAAILVDTGTTLDTAISAILADTGTDGVVVAAASKTGYALSTTGIDALYTRQLTEAYAADGAAPTVAQALMQIQQMLTEFSISSTTMTVKKLDGSTTAFTLTLSDASAPTGLTRAT